MLQCRMMRGKFCDREAGASIAEPALENETSNKSRRTRRRPQESRRAFAITIHLLGSERGVASFDHLPMVRWISHRIVEEITAQRANARPFVHDDRFVNNSIAPVTASAIEKTKLIIRIPAAAANPSVHIKRAPRDTITVSKLSLVLSANLIN